MPSRMKFLGKKLAFKKKKPLHCKWCLQQYYCLFLLFYLFLVQKQTNYHVDHQCLRCFLVLGEIFHVSNIFEVSSFVAVDPKLNKNPAQYFYLFNKNFLRVLFNPALKQAMQNAFYPGFTSIQQWASCLSEIDHARLKYKCRKVNMRVFLLSFSIACTKSSSRRHTF